MPANHVLALLLILQCAVTADELPVAPENAALQYWQAFQFVPGDVQALRAAKPSGDDLSWTKQAVSSGSYAILFLRRGATMKSVDWGLALDQGMFCPAPHVAVIDTILNDREQIVAAAVRAGLPPMKKPQARKIVDIAYHGFRAYAEIFQHRQQEEARLPEGDPKRFLSSVALVEWEMKKLEIATDTRTRLRDLMPIDRREQMDAELRKLAGD